MKLPAISLTALVGSAVVSTLPLAVNADNSNIRGAQRHLAPPSDGPSNVFLVPINGNDHKQGGNPFEDPDDGSGGGGGGDGVAPEIVGGIEVNPPRKYKFFAHLGGCGGSLIAPNVVLSAAHCRGVSNSVTLGLHKMVLADGEKDEFLNVEHIPIAEEFIHPDYNTNTLDNDYWMIRLAWPTQRYADESVTLDLPGNTTDGLDLDDGQPHQLTVFGFGTLTSGGSVPNVMMEVEVPYKANADCGSYPQNELTDNMVCAGAAGIDACQGDSGGPIIDTATKKLVGIVSWGYGCADARYPGIYSRVSTGYDGFIKPYLDLWTDGTYPTSPPVSSCRDVPGGWYMSAGSEYNCLWFASGRNCKRYGSGYINGGLVANDACCACGGGFTDTTGPGCLTPSDGVLDGGCNGGVDSRCCSGQCFTNGGPSKKNHCK